MSHSDKSKTLRRDIFKRRVLQAFEKFDELTYEGIQEEADLSVHAVYQVIPELLRAGTLAVAGHIDGHISFKLPA